MNASKIEFKNMLCGGKYTTFSKGIVVTVRKIDSKTWLAEAKKYDKSRFEKSYALDHFHCHSNTRRDAVEHVLADLAEEQASRKSFADYVAACDEDQQAWQDFFMSRL